MTQLQGRSVSYLPGRWTAVLTAQLCLLADLDCSGPMLAACWEASMAQDALERVLAVLSGGAGPSGGQTPGAASFALAGFGPGGVRLVVNGAAHAEVFAAGRDDPLVLAAGAAPGWAEQHVGGDADIRLVADGPDSVERMSPLPLTGGVVLASFVFLTCTRPAPRIGALDDALDDAPREVAGWLPPALSAVPESDGGVPETSGVFRALPWRASFGVEHAADGAADGPIDAAVGPIVDAGVDAGSALAPVPTAMPPIAMPSTAMPSTAMPSTAMPSTAMPSTAMPSTASRRPAGLLVFSTGQTVLLDRDALLGRAPFAVTGEGLHLIELASPNNDISRNHVRITLDGQQVVATDLASTNGTVVRAPGQPPARLRAHDPFAIAPGTVLELAGEISVRLDTVP